MFIYICQAPSCFQFTKKLNNIIEIQERFIWPFVVICGGLWSLPVLVTKFNGTYLNIRISSKRLVKSNLKQHQEKNNSLVQKHIFFVLVDIFGFF